MAAVAYDGEDLSDRIESEPQVIGNAAPDITSSPTWDKQGEKFSLGSHGKLEIYEFARRRLEALPPLREALLQGRDVLALGVPMGPGVGALLREVEAQIDARAAPTSREQALVRGGRGGSRRTTSSRILKRLTSIAESEGVGQKSEQLTTSTPMSSGRVPVASSSSLVSGSMRV